MTFLHAQRVARLGEILGVSVSLALEPIRDPHEAVADPTDVVFGEGSGGLPAAVVPIATAVGVYLSFLEDALERGDAGAAGPVTSDQVAQVSDDILVRAGLPVGARVDDSAFARWGGDLWAEIVTSATHSRTGTPYDQSKHRSIEDYLLASVGEFVLATGAYQSHSHHDAPLVHAVRYAAARASLFRTVMLVSPAYPL